MSLVGKNLTGLHRALTSSPLNTFEMNWKGDKEPELLVHLTNAPLDEWIKIPTEKTIKSCRTPTLKSGTGYSCEGGLNPYECLCTVFRMLLHMWFLNTFYIYNFICSR